MLSASGPAALLLLRVRDAYRAAVASVASRSWSKEHDYVSLGMRGDDVDDNVDDGTASGRASSSGAHKDLFAAAGLVSTVVRRGPHALLQTRWGKSLLAAALFVVLYFAAVATDVPSTVGSYAGSIAGGQAATGAGDAPGSGAASDSSPAESESESAPASAHPLDSAPNFSIDAVRASITRDQYIDAVLRDPVEGLLDPAPIRALCDATRFQDGLVWHCELVNGGIGNVGSMWLNCLRFAIEAGATTIILPRIGHRDEDNLAHLGDGEHSVDLATLYDVDYFLDAWHDACPQMRAVLSDDGIPHLPAVQDSPAVRANRIGELPRDHELLLDAAGWRPALDAWLTAHVPQYQTMSADAPVRVRQRLALANWNRATQDPAFVRAFPRLFRFPDHIRRLAAAALWQMEQTARVAVVADAILFPELTMAAADSRTALDDTSSLVTSLGPGRLPAAPQGFLAAHLRVAEDAAQAHWPGYDAQAPAYLDEAVARNLSVVYLATGSEQHRAMFRADAAARGIRVVTKEDLLDPADLDTLRTLSWDQQAIVDFDVLVHSSFFAGFVRSSFSWSVAIRRSLLPEAGVPVTTRHRRDMEPAASAPATTAASTSLAVPATLAAAPTTPAAPAKNHKSFVEKYRDGLSVVIGRYDGMTITGVWP